MSRYDYRFNPEDDGTAAQLCRLVGPGRRVLELGCAAGAMSAVLTRHYHCSVSGIEADPDAAAEARAHADRVWVADLDANGWETLPGGDRFDVVLAADVLEHLRDPLACVLRARDLLADGGRLVISVPNIAHGGVLAALLCDAFPYRDTGLLDRTHVHFFTRHSLAQMLCRAGFAIDTVQTVDTGPWHPEFAAYWQALPDALREALAQNPAGRAYQIIVQARSLPQPSPQALPALAHDAAQDQWLASLAARLAAGPALRAEAEAARAERDRALAELAAMRQSRIWRWSAPLRRLRRP